MTEVAFLGCIDCAVAEICAIGERQSNQDALGYARQDDLTCFIVSDGTGGHEGGEVAAKLVVNSIKQKFLQEACFGVRALQSYVEFAISQVTKDKLSSPQQRDMSATVATLLFDHCNRTALWAHLGDSRIYMFRNGKVHKISKDHSLAQRLIDAGYVSADQLRTHPKRSILFAAVGAEGDTAPEITKETIQIQDGDAFLMCTDGYWEWVEDAEMEQSLLSSSSSEEWLNNMNAIADNNVRVARKSRDNYSAFAIWLQEPTIPSN